MPKDVQFFDLLEEAAECLRHCTEHMLKCCSCEDPQERLKFVAEVKQFDARATEAIRKTNFCLNNTFITPLDRGDIHRLVHAIDRAVNQVTETLRQVDIHCIDQLPKGSVELAKVLSETADKLYECIELLRTHELKRVQEIVVEVRSLEETGDKIYGDKTKALFSGETDCIKLFTANAFIIGIEKAIDACANLAEVVSNVAVKHS